MKLRTTLLFAGPVLLFALVLSLVLILKPYWTLMDDAGNLEIVARMHSVGFWKTTWEWFMMDLYQDGRLRFLSPIMMAMLYMPGGSNSITMFVLNDCFIFAILFYCAFPFYESVKNSIGKFEKKSFISFFLILALCYPWTHYLFYCPSVTEKLVLLFAAILVHLLYSLNRFKNSALWLLCLLIPIALAINTKEQIVFFFPLFLAIQLQQDQGRRNYFRFVILLALLILSAYLIHWAGTHGEYKAKYGLAGVIANLHNSKSLILLLGVALAAEVCAILQWLKKRDFFAFLHTSAYPLALFLFVIVMLPWGLGFYLNSAVAIFFIICCLIILQSAQDHLQNADLLPNVAVCLIPAAIFVTLLKTGVFYSALGDYRELLGSPALHSAYEKNASFSMPCEEGAFRTNQYSKWFHGMSLSTHLNTAATPEEIWSKGGQWIFSPTICSNGQDAALLDENKVNVLYRGKLKSGFYLVEIKNKKF